MKMVSFPPPSAIAPVRRAYRSGKKFLRAAPYYGMGRWCPVCEKRSRRFRDFGITQPRREAECVHCGALERHRLVWLYWNRKTDLFDGRKKNVLHIAPERCFQSRLKERLGDSYLTADLSSARAQIKMDITDIQRPEGSFDAIYASHVLEHVPEDRQAMREFHRVLKPGGWAILLVPITVDKTFEDPSVTDPEERLRLFGQRDHVRRYGPDYVDRLGEAGFKVTCTTVSDLFSSKEIVRMGLTPDSGEIYYCTR